MRKISLFAASFLLASSLQADSFDLADAFENGKISGDITIYGEKVSDDATDPGFTMGSIGLGYETESYKGFKAAVAFRGNNDFSEENDGDYGDNDTKAVMSIANISYENDLFALTIGRQEIDLEWMGDFHEAVVGAIKSIPNTSLVVGYSKRATAVDPDGALANFSKFNNDDGAFVVDLKYEGIDNIAIDIYGYSADNIANWYGVKIDYDIEQFGATGHYASSSEDVAGVDDGSIVHFELRGGFKGVSFNAGYISTDSDGGIGSMDALGDNINPLEEGNEVYSANSDTFYIGASYEYEDVALGAMYGNSDFGSGDEDEFDFTAEYSVNDQMTIGGVFATVDGTNNDYNKFALTLAYSF